MKASFFRNASNYEMLHYNSIHYNGIVAEYYSIATIYLEESEFTLFCNDFQSSYKYLTPFVDETMTGRVWKCVSIAGKGGVVLAVMDHYQYPRYLAIESK